MAACISVIIALIIEVKLTQKTFVKGLNAIMNRTVPEPIWEDFRKNVITQRKMRKNMVITMDFQGIHLGENFQRCKSATSVKYTLVTLVHKQNAQVSHHRDIHRTPKEASSAKFSLKVEGTPWPFCTEDGMINFQVKLSKNHPEKRIEYEFKELIYCPDVAVWSMSLSTLCVALEIKNLPKEWSVDVEMNHPPDHRMPKVGTNQWGFNGVLLPGQGFEIRIRPEGSGGPQGQKPIK